MSASWPRRKLPVFGAIVFAVHATGSGGPAVDAICTGILLARVVQSSVHLSVPQTSRVVSVRFSFFFLQLIGFGWLLAMLAAGVVPGR